MRERERKREKDIEREIIFCLNMCVSFERWGEIFAYNARLNI